MRERKIIKTKTRKGKKLCRIFERKKKNIAYGSISCSDGKEEKCQVWVP